MNFVKNYYWILDRHVYPFQLPNNKEYTEVWNQWLYEDENRKKKLNQMIESEKSIVRSNNLKNKWLSLPEEVRNKISADYNERLRKIREETREKRTIHHDVMYHLVLNTLVHVMAWFCIEKMVGMMKGGVMKCQVSKKMHVIGK